MEAMKLMSRRLGEIEIDENRVITFPHGIPGFENDREYAIFPVVDEEGPFYYMHAVSNPDLCLVLAVPFVFFPDYELELPSENLEILGIVESERDLAVFVVLTIPGDFRDTTANLLAPIIVNPATRRGLQYVIENSRYQTKHPIFPQPQTNSRQRQGL